MHVADIRILCPITSPDDTLISDKRGNIISRWRLFQALLNRPNILPSPTLRQAASEAAPVDIIPVAVTTQSEIASAIAKLQSFRALGICGIQPQLM